MTIKLSAAELTHVVTAVPGVRGIEPGIGSTLKAIGSRMSGDPATARFGIIIESGAQKGIFGVGIPYVSTRYPQGPLSCCIGSHAIP